MRPDRLILPATAVLLVAIWGTTWAAIKVSLEGFPPIAGVALRFGLAAAVLLTAAGVYGVRLGASAVERRLWLVQAVGCFAVPYGVVYWAEQWIPSGLASVLFSTFPLFVVLLSHLLLPQEPIRWRAIAGVAVGFAGVAVLFSEDFSALGGSQGRSAAAMMLLSPLVAAVAHVAVKRWGRGLHPLSLTAVPMALTALAMALLAGLSEGGWQIRWHAGAVAATLYLALVGSALTFTLYFWLLARVRATSLSLVAFAVPLVAVVFGALALGEPLTIKIALGSGLVLAGVGIVLSG